jgi:prepilin-type N-terminal cleavage/methylation domain-containing protein
VNLNAKSAFTIVELLIVVVVVAILATIVAISYSGITSRATETGLKTDLISQSKKNELEKIQSGSMNTTTVEAFRSVTTKNATIEYKYGDLNGQCIELTSIKTPTKQFYIDSTGSISQTVEGTCPTPTSEVTLRCVASKVVVIVSQTNYMSDNVVFGFSAPPYGSSTSASISPGTKANSTAFTTGFVSIPAGVATIQVTNSTTSSLSTTRFQPYPAYNC